MLATDLNALGPRLDNVKPRAFLFVQRVSRRAGQNWTRMIGAGALYVRLGSGAPTNKLPMNLAVGGRGADYPGQLERVMYSETFPWPLLVGGKEGI